MSRLDILAEVKAAILEDQALLAAHLARLAERRAEGRDAVTAEVLVRVDRAHLASLREHRRWLLARKAAAGTRQEPRAG